MKRMLISGACAFLASSFLFADNVSARLDELFNDSVVVTNAAAFASPDDIDSVKNEISDLQDSVTKEIDSVNADISGVRTDVSNLDASVKNDMKAVRESITSLENTVSNDIDSVQNDIDGLGNTVSSLGNTVTNFNTTVNSNIDNLREDTNAQLDGKADASSVYTKTASDARFYPKAEGDLWSSWWSGDGFRVTVTNYDVGANADVVWGRLPAAYFEYRIDETGDHIRVWNELTRWNRFLEGYAAFTNAMNAAVASKADRAWGFYDSASGAYSPDDYLQISQPNVIIAAGMSYQKAATASGSYWVLTSTGGQTSLGGTDTNGFFRISDADGNAQIEIVRGDKRIVGADASGVEVQQVGDGRTALVVSYAITGDHPTLSMALSLESGSQWFTEDDETKPATVAWSGHSGAWTATITPNAATSQLFARAEYAVGGDTYLRSLIPISITHLIIGGTKYSLGTATIDGKTVLTLTEVR